MGIIKDWKKDNQGYCFRYKVLHLISPKFWFTLHKYRQQRADRGWSDRDIWGTGDYIAGIVAEMLQDLNDNSYHDREDWFSNNTKNRGVFKYETLQQIIDDINNYLDFEETSWSDDYDLVPKDIDRVLLEKNSSNIFNTGGWQHKITGEILTEKQLSDLIRKHSEKEARLYKKATDAMKFFGNNFGSFWD